jgi:biotin carboxyl carrier protein
VTPAGPANGRQARLLPARRGPSRVAGWLRGAALGLAVLLAAPAPAGAADAAADGDATADARIVFPTSVQQGAMVLGKVPPGSVVAYAGRTLRTTGYGTVVFGVGRDATGPLVVTVDPPAGRREVVRIAVTARDWPVQRVDGVPPRTVDPPPAIAERIRREQARVAEARLRDDPRTDFAQRFVVPVEGRISGRFGRARVYNGKPGSPHSGMDIAAPSGTPVKAPAAGIVTFADPDLYLTGGTLVIDHGHGISSNFLHLSRIDVRVGDRVEQGQVVAAVGSTGRSTGPHLHWGMNWFDVRIDPQLVPGERGAR